MMSQLDLDSQELHLRLHEVQSAMFDKQVELIKDGLEGSPAGTYSARLHALEEEYREEQFAAVKELGWVPPTIADRLQSILIDLEEGDANASDLAHKALALLLS